MTLGRCFSSAERKSGRGDQLRPAAANTLSSWDSECLSPGGDLGGALSHLLPHKDCSMYSISVIGTMSSMCLSCFSLTVSIFMLRYNLHKTIMPRF